MNAYRGVEGSWGTYNVESGSFLRRHIGNVDPNLEDKLASGAFKLAGDTFAWSDTDAVGRKFEATYRRGAAIRHLCAD